MYVYASYNCTCPCSLKSKMEKNSCFFSCLGHHIIVYTSVSNTTSYTCSILVKCINKYILDQCMQICLNSGELMQFHAIFTSFYILVYIAIVIAIIGKL